MTKVYIMRGVPGAGKSRWVRDNLPDALIVSCDRYFTGEDGVYRFDPAKLAENHNKCLREFVRLIDGSLTRPNTRPVVVDNTNTKVFEIAPYYRLAEAFGCEVKIIWMISPPHFCKERNVHGVPPATIDAMFTGAEPLPPWWNVIPVIKNEG